MGKTDKLQWMRRLLACCVEIKIRKQSEKSEWLHRLIRLLHDLSLTKKQTEANRHEQMSTLLTRKEDETSSRFHEYHLLDGGIGMEDYLAQFKRKIAEIGEDAQKAYIINAGSMNHGKSSLFNSLLDEDIFAEQDIRTTTEAQVAEWESPVYLVDTPGLNAEERDDEEAYAAYRKANMIVFVHTVNAGELKENELDAINQIKGLFESEAFFWQHFCLVFTFIDAVPKTEDLAAIREKSLSDIERVCGGKEFRTFTVSNTRYKKGRDEGKPKMVKMSGIPELQKYLRDNFGAWLAENGTRRNARIQREREDMVALLEEKREKIKKQLAAEEQKIEERQEAFLRKVETAVRQRQSDEQEIRNMQDMLGTMKRELSDLRDRHQRAKASY